MRNSIMRLVLASVLVLAVTIPALAQETDPLAIVRSDSSSIKDKADACRELSMRGGPEAVPVLAPMLLDAKLSHYARLALEPMPCPEAGAALRDALGKASARLQVGIIDSLAERRDTKAVPAFIGLLGNSDTAVVETAARGLGTINTPEGVKALLGALDKGNLPPLHRKAICDGLFAAAEQMAAKGQNSQAEAVYSRVLKEKELPRQVNTAALRGAILTSETQKKVALIKQALTGEDRPSANAALRAARELGKNAAFTNALTAVLPGVPAARKIGILQVLGYRGDAAAGPAVLTEAKQGEAAVRIAALRAATQLEYDPTIDVLVQLAVAEEGEVTTVARDLLSHFPGEAKATAIKGMLKNNDAKIRRLAVGLIAAGGLQNPTGLLMGVAENDADQGVRLAALETLKGLAGMDEMPRLLAVLLKPRSEQEAKAAETDIAALAERQKQVAGGDVVIQKALYGVVPDGKHADVTAKVAEMVKNGTLSIDATNANFGDAAPGQVKQLSVTYAVQGVVLSKTVRENQSLKLTVAVTPPTVVDALCGALDKSQGAATSAVLRLLGGTGTPKALEAVRAVAAKAEGEVWKTALDTLCKWPNPAAAPAVVDSLSAALNKAQGDAKAEVLGMLGGMGTEKALQIVRTTADQGSGPLKEAALRTLCEWPNELALPMLKDLSKSGPDATIKTLALRGYIRLLKQSKAAPAEVLKLYAGLLDQAAKADEKRLVLSGLAELRTAEAMALVLTQLSDASIKDEVVQAALRIARGKAQRPTPEEKLFNGKDLTGWEAKSKYWSVQLGAIVGSATEPIPATTYLWSTVQAGDFYFSAEVKLTPATANSGIQFRSKKINDAWQALGLQGDIGQNVWGRLYHQGGRGKLDWNGRAEGAVKAEDWNKFEILAIGPAIFTAINGKLGVACLDPAVREAPSGAIAFQLHQGNPQTVRYRNLKLIHNPPVELAGLNAEQLLAELKMP